MTPLRRRAITCAARCEQRKAALRFTAKILSHQVSSASRKWRAVLVKLALFTSTSIVPNRSSVVSNKRSTWLLSETSAMPARADPPLAMMLCVVASALTVSTSLTMTCAPSLPKRRAIARPMPFAAPVTITTLSLKRCPFCITILPPQLSIFLL